MKPERAHIAVCYVIPFIALIGLSLPRFNQPYTIFYGPQVTFEENPDVHSYWGMIRHFRNDRIPFEYEAPFSYRTLAPFVASLMPFDVESSFSLTNILFLCLSLYFTLHVLRIYGFLNLSPCVLLLLGGGMFSISFPVLWYTTSGFTEAVTLCLISAGYYFLLQNRMFPFTMTILIGTFANEKILILVPLLFAHWWMRGELRDRLSSPFVILGVFLVVVCLVGARFILPGPPPGYWWDLSPGWILYNATRPRTYVSVILTLGIPGLLSLLWLLGCRFRVERDFVLPVVGIATVLVLYLFSFMTASASGRFLWMSYPFLVVTAVKHISQVLAARGKEGSIKDA